MPIFQEHHPEEADAISGLKKDEQAAPTLIRPQTDPADLTLDPILSRKLSEESIRTELCDGPVPDSPRPPQTPELDTTANTVSDRSELIERLKRGESPTWIPNRHLESLFHADVPRTPRSPAQTPRQPTSATSPTLLPPATITPEKASTKDNDGGGGGGGGGGEVDHQRYQEGLNIERPRSALHSGDFTLNNESPSREDGSRTAHQESGASPNGGIEYFRSGSGYWLATSTSPPRNFDFEKRQSLRRGQGLVSGPSSLSSSLSQSFAYQPPTSPLVQSESNDDIDLSLPMTNFAIASGSPINARRHTLNFLNSPSSLATPAALSRQSPLPYQAHQPRRSLTSTPSFPLATSSPQTPAFLRPRRPSFSSDASPLQHASMVGSYEESILRGRMSTTPSKPLDFLAQIGVLGLGKCKGSLRCPPHVTLPFSAVFYSYASTSHGRSESEDGPSPYVGQIDLENGLPNPEDEQRTKRKLQSRYPEKRKPEPSAMDLEDSAFDGPVIPEAQGHAAARQKRRSRSPKAPPGGRYRIPEKGQLQIIIKNQNKTAVKLFLIPYDLAGMEPGTKTFIRQRSYSSGAIVDTVPDLKDSRSSDRPTLRYLVHLHICCPSRGRYYLYKSIRVVFANRVPDGKEKLHNEITYPEPRFTPYKPVRVMHPPAHHPGRSAATLATEKAFRRRSSGLSFGNSNHHHQHPYPFETLPPPIAGFGGGGDVEGPAPFLAASSQPPHPFLSFTADNNPVDPIPFKLPQKGGPAGNGRHHHSSSSADGTTVGAAPASINIGFRSPGSSPISQSGATAAAAAAAGVVGGIPESPGTPGQYDKLCKGDVGYGGNAFVPPNNGSPGAAEGLLSKRLRSLGVHGRQMAE